MQITSLYIDDYKLLKQFHINFRKDVSILIGINGSGKSSVLECLAYIFRCVHLSLVENKKESCPFEFDVSYTVKLDKTWANRIFKTDADDLNLNELNDVQVTISNRNVINTSFQILTNSQKYSTEQIINSYGIDKLIPQNVLIYYSGLNDIMEILCKEHEEIYKERLRTTARSTEKGYEVLSAIPMLYIKEHHFDILLASLFSFEYNLSLDAFFANLNMVKPLLSTIVLYVKKKEWEKGTNEINFWGAKGLVAYFLTLCRDNALSKYIYDQEREVYSFIFNLDNWYKLREEYVEEKKLFYILHMLQSSDMLSGIDVFITKNKIDIDQHKLSEGEQQLITIRGIKELLIEQNTLLLFDEPDTFLHPSLQDDMIINITDEQNTNLPQSHYVITTHNPSFISNLDDTKGELFILLDGHLHPHNLKWFGRDSNDTLHQIMGAPNRPAWAEEEIQRVDALIESDISQGEAKFEKLKEKLSLNDMDIIRLQTKLDFLKQ